ncbi:MAG: DUF4347 domain-containing protein [Planctomycetes bacterium]|nr:DUF4347 domain-containing protein [Planctomycetota bacterium]
MVGRSTWILERVAAAVVATFLRRGRWADSQPARGPALAGGGGRRRGRRLLKLEEFEPRVAPSSLLFNSPLLAGLIGAGWDGRDSSLDADSLPDKTSVADASDFRPVVPSTQLLQTPPSPAPSRPPHRIHAFDSIAGLPSLPTEAWSPNALLSLSLVVDGGDDLASETLQLGMASVSLGREVSELVLAAPVRQLTLPEGTTSPHATASVSSERAESDAESPALAVPTDSEPHGGRAEATAEAPSPPRTIVFVDAGVEDYQALIDELPKAGLSMQDSPLVVVLEAGKDGVQQIADALKGRDELSAVHILSHGAPGSLQLGTAQLDGTTVTQYAGPLALWGSALADDGDLLLYGCDVAAGEAGVEFIRDLGHLTKADIAASVDLTGSEAQGGDWSLEYNRGQVEAQSLTFQSYEHLLGSVVLTGGKLVFSDDGTENNDLTLSVSDDGAEVVLRDANSELNAGEGTAQSDPNAVTVPLASLLAVEINAQGGDDTLTVDFPVPTGGLTYDGGEGSDTLVGPGVDSTWNVTGGNAGTLDGNVRFNGVENLAGAADNEDTFVFGPDGGLSGVVDGGAGGFDSVVLDGGQFARVVFVAYGPDSGTIARDGNVVTYAGMEPLSDNSDAAEREFNGTAIADRVTMFRPSPGHITIESDNDLSDFESVTFSDPSQSLTIKLGYNAVGTDEHVYVEELGDFPADLTIDGEGGPDKVEFRGDVRLVGHNLTVKAETIEVEDNVVISTRTIASSAGNHLTDASTGNSGAIEFDSTTRTDEEWDGGSITVGAGAALLAQADSGYTPGKITLSVDNYAGFSGFLVAQVKITNAVITLGANSTVKGGEVLFSAVSDASRSFDDASEAAETTIDVLESLTTFAGVAISDADAEVVVHGGSVIEAGKLTIKADATAQARVFTVSTAIGVAYCQGDPTAKVRVEDGATITTSGDLELTADAESEVKAQAYTVNLGQGRGAPMDVTVAVARSNIESTAEVERGAQIQAGGDMTLKATMTKTMATEAWGGAYEDGSVGIGLALSFSESDVHARMDGDAKVGGSVTIQADSDTPKNDTAASSAVGSGLIAGKVIKAANGAVTAVENFLKAHGPSPSPKAGANPIGLSAAFAYAKHDNDTIARIGEDASVVAATGGVTVQAATLDVPEISAIATVDSAKLEDSPNGNTKQNSVSAAVVVGFYDNTTKAYVGSNATVTAAGDVRVDAETRLPYEIQWLELNGLSDLTDKINANFGIQNGFFTSWAQSAEAGTKTALAGSVNWLKFVNTTEAYIAKDAQINQNVADYGEVRVEADTLIQTVNLSGVVGLKFFGTQGGVGGVGGAFLELTTENTTTARIEDGARVNADALLVRADTVAFAVAIAESGGAADAFAINGSFSLVRTHNATFAGVDDGANVTVGSSTLGIRKDLTRLFGSDNIFLDIPDALEGVGVEDKPLILDTNDDGDVDTDDEHITSVDDGGTSDDPFDDVYRTDLSQLVAAEDDSQIYTVSGGIVKSQNVGIGASVSINEIERRTQAVVGQPVFSPARISEDDDAMDLGYAHGFDTGDAVVYDNGGGASIGGLTNGQTYYVIRVSPTELKLASSEPNADDGDALSLDLSDAHGDAHSLRRAGETLGSGAVDSNGEAMVASLNQGVIGTFSLAAAVTGPSPTGQNLTMKNAPQGGGKYGLGISADVSLNEIRDIAEACLSYANFTHSGDLDLSATNDSVIVGLAGAVTVAMNPSGSAGLAGAYAQNTLDSAARAFINRSAVTLTGDLDMDARTDGDMTVVTVSGTASTRGSGVAGAVSVNSIESETLAFIANGSDVAAGEVDLDAKDTPRIVTVTGGIVAISMPGLGGIGGIGAAVSVVTIDAETRASIADSDVRAADSLELRAKSDPNIVTVAIAVANGSYSMSVAASVAINTINADTSAYIRGQKSDDGIQAAHGVSLSATDDSDIVAVTGGAGFGLQGTGVGLSFSYNEIDNTTQAYVAHATVAVPAGDLKVKAEETSSIHSIALGGAFGNRYGVAGSVTVSYVGNETKAHISDSTVFADGNVVVSAMDDLDLLSIAGNIAGAGTGALGIANSTLVTDTTVEAYVSGNIVAQGNNPAFDAYTGQKDEDGDPTTVSTKGLVLTAVSFEEVTTGAVGGVGAGQTGIAGSATATRLDETTRAYIADGATVNGSTAGAAADQSVYVLAADQTNIASFAGAVAGGGASGIAAGLDVGIIRKDTQAHIGASATVNARGDVLVYAVSTESILSVAGSVAIGGSAGIAGSAAAYDLENTTRAYIGANARVAADGNVVVTAYDERSWTCSPATWPAAARGRASARARPSP